MDVRITLIFRTNLIGPEDQLFQKANSDLLLAAYRAHNAAVQALVPKDKLLVYRIGEGRVPRTPRANVSYTAKND